MATRDESWYLQERRFIDRFFQEKVPKAFGDKAASLCTEEACILYAKRILQTDGVVPVANQGSNSFTLQTESIIVQFRLNPLKRNVLALANEIYRDLVPAVTLHDDFPIPVYTSNVIPGQVHLLQPLPAVFPLERETTTVTELALFVAKAAFFEQPESIQVETWTNTAPMTLDRLAQNSSLRSLAPEVANLVRRLQTQVHLLDRLPKVLTHHDFAQVNILVNDFGNVTGVLDFDEAGVEAFGMCIWGLYECFFGSMEDGKWAFYEQAPLLENAFWDTLWANTPAKVNKKEAETAVKVALSIGAINRYFVDGMMDDIDVSMKIHRLSLEYAKGILPRVWE